MPTGKGRAISAVLLAAILVFIILFAAGKIGAVTGSESGCTMKQAYEIALPGARKWARDAEVYKIISMDNHDTEDPEHGKDGIRNAWSLFFESAEKRQQYNIYVVNGRIYAEEAAVSPAYRTIAQGEMPRVIDSGAAYAGYADCLRIKGGTEWAFGYHYILDYGYLNGPDEEPVLTMTMRGLLENGNEASVIMDPFDGHLLRLLEKTGYDSGGNSVWESVPFDESLSLTREEMIERYDIYEAAKKNLMDPEELADAFMRGIHSSRFSPFSEVVQYSREEWERLMTERYGDAWKDW